MQALASWPRQARRGITGVFTDIDDTLTTGGSLTADAQQAMLALRAAGITVVPITGRPAGWCAPFMAGTHGQAWPVDAMVAENGAVAFIKKNSPQPLPDKRQLLSKIYQQDAATRAEHARRMQAVAAQVLAQVAGIALARDSAGRETDLAFDYAEFANAAPEVVQRVLALLHKAGMQTTVSSIHIHGSFAHIDKWQGACWIAREYLHTDLAKALDRWVFVGDSGNDQAMFAQFTHSVGVANIRRFAAQMQHLPRFVAPSERGAGFAEVARALLEARA